jgi:alkylated DNA nucleotide flippase Atl1
MEQQKDAIVDIPENRVKYFGRSGKMLLPCPATVEALIQKIPENKLMTTGLLLKTLTEQFDVEGVCPVTTQKALRAIANDPSRNVAYWRVVKKNGELFAAFPGGVEGHADRLRREGFTIDTQEKAAKVKNFRENLIHPG